jgi:hypothetical protein
LPAAGLKKNGSFEHVGSEVALWTKTKGASDEYAVTNFPSVEVMPPSFVAVLSEVLD